MDRPEYITRFFFMGMLLFCLSYNSYAQDTLATPKRVKDTGQIIHLLNADVLLGIQGNKEDSSQYQKLIGHVKLQQGGTIFTCDSALQNLTNNTINAYGNIHINQADTINTYADFLHYEGNTRMATLKKNVRMTDGHMVLTTNLLNYDMQTHVGSYLNGGELDNKSTVLTSQRGYYYADTKNVFFKKKVKLNDPQYTLTTDTLKYNTRSRIATFVAPTAINTGKTIIYTSCGYYNTDQGFSHLCSQPSIVDSSGTLTADSMDFNKAAGLGTGYGHVTWTDSSGQISIKSGYAVSNQNKKTILATKKPLMILSQKSDTLFVASDTLFSAPLFNKDTSVLKMDTTGSDTLSYVYIKPSNPVVKHFEDSVTRRRDSLFLPILSSAYLRIPDSIRIPFHPYGISSADSIKKQLAPLYPDSAQRFFQDTIKLPAVAKLHFSESIKELSKDSITLWFEKEAHSPASKPKDSAQMRNMIAYHHVRLFSDSLQGVADSLYYSDADSSFHFYKDPVLWTGVTQLTGDTIVMKTKDRKASRLLLQENAMIVNKVGPGLYNQIKGTTITGYFNDSSQLKWMLVEGNAESIYYAQEDNGDFVGVNKTTSAAMRLYFKDNHLNKVVFLKDVSGTFKNPSELTEKDKQLEGFRWESDLRPRSKADLFRVKKERHDAKNRRRKQPEGSIIDQTKTSNP